MPKEVQDIYFAFGITVYQQHDFGFLHDFTCHGRFSDYYAGKMGTKAVLEAKECNRFMTENEVRAIRYMDGVICVNRLADNAVYPVNFNVVTNSDSEEENNRKVTLLSYDDLGRDSAFSELRYRLMKGNMITEGSENGAVINFGLPYDSSIYQKTGSDRCSGTGIRGFF